MQIVMRQVSAETVAWFGPAREGGELTRTALVRAALADRTLLPRAEDRHLDEAEDLRKCLAFDAITAFRVWGLSLLARERPEEPARRHVTREDVTALCALASHHGFKIPRGPPEMTIARFVMLTAGLAGFHPSKHQPLSGTQKPWEGVRCLSNAVIAIRAMLDWDGSEAEGEFTESHVLD